MNKLSTFLLLLFLTCCFQTFAQEGGESKAAELARKLANPNATLGFLAFPIDYTRYDGDLPNASEQSAFKINFQPSFPYPISEGTNFFLRPLLPIIVQQPVITGDGFEDRGTELGDLAFDAALGKTWPSKWVTIIGVFGSAPTATDDALGANQWTFGPNGFLGRATSWGFAGVLVNHSWGLGGSEKADISITGGQYFYTIQLEGAWQIQAQPTFAYNHNAPDGSQLTLPLGTGVSNIYMIGNLPVKFNFQYWYYVARPDPFGPQHTFRFQIIPIIPLPW